jgi:cyclic beta-1,2-glucan synthetase
VWLAWFAVATIEGFVGLCRRRGDADLADRWQRHADELARTVDDVAWDGEWYLRAFDDDGRPWGSASGDECRIDSIVQSWAVLAGVRSPERAHHALAAAERELVTEDPGLVRLLWPPFEHTPRDPGYIRSYPPGIRENGGQYTHAAAWLGLALAELGDGDRATRILELINPIRQAATRATAARHLVEPYVLAADVAATPPHVGRGGWTWYTGSAAWAWRLGVEAILGLRLRDGRLVIDPRIPREWGGFEAEIRGPAGCLAVRVEDPDGVGTGVVAVGVDGTTIEGAVVAFPTDGSTRHVAVRLGAAARAAGAGGASDASTSYVS